MISTKALSSCPWSNGFEQTRGKCIVIPYRSPGFTPHRCSKSRCPSAVSSGIRLRGTVVSRVVFCPSNSQDTSELASLCLPGWRRSSSSKRRSRFVIFAMSCAPMACSQVIEHIVWSLIEIFANMDLAVLSELDVDAVLAAVDIVAPSHATESPGDLTSRTRVFPFMTWRKHLACIAELYTKVARITDSVLHQASAGDSKDHSR